MNHGFAKSLLLTAFGVFLSSAAAIADVKVTFLDVHQGDCIIIRNGAKTIMIDAGDDKLDAAARYIIPFLKQEGIKKIDQAIITHPHRDHFGGFIDLVKDFSFGEFVYSNDTDISSEGKEAKRGSGDAIAYNNLKNLILEKGIKYRKAQLGELLNWGEGVKAEVVSCDNPKLVRALEAANTSSASSSTAAKINPNEISIVVKMTYGKISYMFTGDAEKKAETEMVERYGKKLACTVLKSGHHGSKTSSNHNFMDTIQPKYGVIQVGKGNSFGHPTKQTLDVYDYYKMKVFRNDEDGTIESITDGEKVEFISNQSAVEFASKPKVIAITGNSATLQWTTNKEAVSKVEYTDGSSTKTKASDSSTKTHTITLVGLKPNTEYNYVAYSADPRETAKVVKVTGTIKTLDTAQSMMPSIVSLKTNFDKVYMRHPFKILCNVKNPSDSAMDNLTVELYHSSINSSNLIEKITTNLSPKDAGVLVSNTKIDWLGKIEIIAVLKKGNTIIDTSSTSITMEAKQIYVDCAHGNKDYFTGRFAGMKMDLFQHYGMQLKSLSKAITFDAIKDGFLLIIPHPTTAFTTEELNSIKKFTKVGGSVLMYGQSDFGNKSHPEIQNKVLEALGSQMRFNDDQVCDPTNNIGAPFRFFVTKFPNESITGEDCSKLLLRSTCSIMGANGKSLRNSGKVKIVACGDEDSYNQEGDEQNDAYIYPVGNVPVAAVEELEVGRVGCIGENLYQDTLYGGTSNKQLSTPQFNRGICYWLSLSKEKTLRNMTRTLAQLDYEGDPEVRAQRYEELSKEILNNVRQSIENNGNGLNEIKRELNRYEGESINQLRRQINQLDSFHEVHAE